MLRVLAAALLFFGFPAFVFGEPAKSEPDIFTVGAVIPLTGPLADYGQSVQQGFSAAQRSAPEKFKNIQFVFQDSAYDGKTALSALQNLIGGGHVDLFYTWGVTPNESLLPVLHGRKLPVIAETTFKSSVVGKPLAIRAAPSGEMTAKVLANEIKRRNYRTVGVLLVDIPYYRDILEALTRELVAGGVTVTIIDELAADFKAFPTIITKIRNRAFDAVGVFLLNDQVISFYKDAANLKFDLPTFGAGIHDSQDLISQSGSGAEGAFFVGYDVDPEFHANWLREFKNDSRIGCIANAYDTAIMIAELFGDGRSSSLTPEETIQRFSKIGPKEGMSGPFQFADTEDAGKHFDFPLSLRVVKDGKVFNPNR